MTFAVGDRLWLRFPSAGAPPFEEGQAPRPFLVLRRDRKRGTVLLVADNGSRDLYYDMREVDIAEMLVRVEAAP